MPPELDSGTTDRALDAPDAQEDGGYHPATIDSATLIAASVDGFDPVRHEVDPAGAPILTPTGRFKKKPSRRVKNILSPTPSATPVQRAAKTRLDVQANKMAAVELSRAMLTMLVGTMASLVGPEWEFENQEEADGLKGALAAYLESRGDVVNSPALMLGLCFVGYAVPRLRHANTRGKLGRFFDWSKSALGRVFRVTR